MHHFPMQVLGRCQTFINSLWSASFAFEVLCIHILKCESYFMALVCIKFYFIEAKLTLLIFADQESFCEDCDNFVCD